MAPARRPVRAVVPVVLALLFLPVPGVAQIPGGDPNEVFDRRDAARAQVRAEALGRVNETLGEWADAWLEDEADGLMDAYAEGARVRGLPFGFVAGEEALEEQFAAFLPRVGDIRLNLREFNASGRLAYGVGSYRFHSAEGGDTGTMRRGTVMTVFLKQDSWKILSQLFVPGEENRGS